jgi:RNA polymerase sigma-70 factor (ECF subfamily)
MGVRKLDVERLYAAYGPAIYARCRRLLKDAVAAEDATQDIFVKLIRHLESAPEEVSAQPWIHRITTNHCFNVLRDAKRRATPVDEIPELVDDDFEDSVVTRNFAERVLANSPETLKTPAMLYHGKGMEQSKVAQTLGCSRRTVLYRLSEFTRRAMQFHEAVEAGRG